MESGADTEIINRRYGVHTVQLYVRLLPRVVLVAVVKKKRIHLVDYTCTHLSLLQ